MRLVDCSSLQLVGCWSPPPGSTISVAAGSPTQVGIEKGGAAGFVGRGMLAHRRDNLRMYTETLLWDWSAGCTARLVALADQAPVLGTRDQRYELDVVLLLVIIVDKASPSAEPIHMVLHIPVGYVLSVARALYGGLPADAVVTAAGDGKSWCVPGGRLPQRTC